MGAPNGVGSQDQVTVGDTRYSRLKVEVGSSAFSAQRAFRGFYEFSIPTATRRVIRFSSPINFKLKLQDLSVDTGGIRLVVNTGVTPTGVYTPIQMFGMNRTLPVTGYVQQTSMATGGDFTGGTIVEVVRVRSASATAATATVSGDTGNTGRDLPPGDYYILLEPLSGVAGTSTGVYSLEVEELPS